MPQKTIIKSPGGGAACRKSNTHTANPFFKKINAVKNKLTNELGSIRNPLEGSLIFCDSFLEDFLQHEKIAIS